MYEKITYYVCMIYIFTIIAFGDSSDMYVISNGVFLVLLALICVYIINHSMMPVNVLLFLPFTIYAFSSIIWSYLPEDSYERATTVLRLLILFIAISLFIYNTKMEKKFLNGIAFCGVFTLAYVISVYGIDGLMDAMQDGTRVGGEITNANTLAIFLAMAMVILLFNFINKRKIIYLLLVIAIVVMIALTGSKKGLIDIVVGFVLVILLTQKDSEGAIKWLRLFAMVGGMALAFYFAWQLPIFSVVRERFELMFSFLSGSSTSIDYSTRERQLMIEYGMRQFYQTPVLGIGIGASGYITQSAVGFKTYLHNNFVELLASGGIIGFLLYYIPIVYLLYKCWKYRKESDEAVVCFIIIFIQLVNDYGAVSYFSKFTYVLFAVAWATIMNIESENFDFSMKERYEK